MKSNKYVCLWCDNDGEFNYQECENETEIKTLFHKIIDEGFYDLAVHERKVEK